MIHAEIQDTYKNDRLQVEIPSEPALYAFIPLAFPAVKFCEFLKSPMPLLNQRVCCIIKRSVSEKSLSGTLHLYNKVRSVLVPAINVENDFAVRVYQSEPLPKTLLNEKSSVSFAKPLMDSFASFFIISYPVFFLQSSEALSV